MQSRPLAKTLLALGSVPFLTTMLDADVTTAYYNSPSDFGYHLDHMPDFDQRRTGLPFVDDGAPGNNYCVPTSCTDLLAYMASHGEPSLGPAFADWEAGDDFDAVTDFILDLGDDMGTSASSGTNGDDAFVVMYNRVAVGTNFRYMVGYEFRTQTNTVTLAELAVAGISADAIQTVHYGRYDEIGTLNGSTVVSRTGGHCCVLVGAERSGSYRHIWLRDPANGSDFDTQAAFVEGDWDAPWVPDLVVAPDLTTAASRLPQGMSRIMRNDPATYRLIDKRILIFPLLCSGWGDWDGESSSITTSTWSPDIEQLLPRDQGSVPFRPQRILQFPFGDLLVLERLDNGHARLWRAPEGPDTWAPMVFSDSEGPDFLDFAISKDLGILGLGTDGRLYEFPGDVGAPITPATTRVLLDGLQGYDRLSTDLATGQAALVDLEEGFMKVVDRYFEEVRTLDIRSIHTISGQHQQVFGDFDRDGRNEIIVQGSASSGQETVTMIDLDDAEPRLADVSPQLLGDCTPNCSLRGLSVDDSGALLLNIDGQLRAYVYVPNGQGEGMFLPAGIVEGGNLLEGLAVGDGFAVGRSFTNYDPRQHDTPGWNTVLDESGLCDTEECAVEGDLNGDLKVDGEDLAILLGAWNTDDASADLDGDGLVAGGDLAILLGVFGS